MTQLSEVEKTFVSFVLAVYNSSLGLRTKTKAIIGLTTLLEDGKLADAPTMSSSFGWGMTSQGWAFWNTINDATKGLTRQYRP